MRWLLPLIAIPLGLGALLGALIIIGSVVFIIGYVLIGFAGMFV